MIKTTLEHINLYFGGEWKSVVEFAKDFREENEGDDHAAMMQLLIFLNSMNTATEMIEKEQTR